MAKDRDRVGIWLGVGFLALLVMFSFYLGVNRIFQVDEVQYTFEARLLATGKAAQYSISAPIFLLGPLTWLAGAARNAVEVLVWLRMPFVVLMWVNVALLVKGAGFRLRSRGGLGALLLASTLAPMWDYGFEIRHDVLLLTGILGMWCLVRQARLSLAVRFGLLGFLAAFLQFIAFKSFIFSLPLLVILGLHARSRTPRAWLGLGLALGCGLAAGYLTGRGISMLGGTWSIFRNDQGASLQKALGVDRMSGWPTFHRLLDEAPLLAYAGLVALFAPFKFNGSFHLTDFLDREGTAEWIFALAALAALVMNPTPYPYNLILLIPPFFLLVAAFRRPFWEIMATLPAGARNASLAFLMLLHVLPWAVATSRHLDKNNDDQCAVIRLAEAMTDPKLHRVFDGTGLVSTRDPIGFNWLVHTLTYRNFSNGVWPSVRASLAANPTPVILPNYRLDLLSQEDRTYIHEHYMHLNPNFMVLGGVLESGADPWTSLAEGRYHLDLVPENKAGEAPLVLDGKAVQDGVYTLAKGDHQFQVPPNHRLQVTWLGPDLSDIPEVESSGRPLLVNWY